MKSIRQLIKKGDPRLSVKLPVVTLQKLKTVSMDNKRRLQDQFIKALAESFENNATSLPVLAKYFPNLLELYKQN